MYRRGSSKRPVAGRRSRRSTRNARYAGEIRRSRGGGAQSAREAIIYPRPVPEAIRPATPDEELLGAERPAVGTERTEEERLERNREELVTG